MKTTILSILALVAVSCISACSTVSDAGKQPALVKVAAQTATAVAIDQFGLDDKTTDYLYAIAGAVRSVSGGEVPDVDELTAALNLSISGSQSLTLKAVTVAISSLYASYYDGLDGSTKQSLQLLEAIAEGVEAAATADTR